MIENLYGWIDIELYIRFGHFLARIISFCRVKMDKNHIKYTFLPVFGDHDMLFDQSWEN